MSGKIPRSVSGLNEDMAILLSPLIDSISDLVVSTNKQLDFSNVESYSSIHPTLAAVANFVGVAEIISATIDQELFVPFTQSCNAIKQNLVDIKACEAKLIADPNNSDLYRKEFLPCLEGIATHMGLLLSAQGTSLQDKVDRACSYAIDQTKALLKSVATGGSGTQVQEAAELYKSACVNVTKASQRAAAESDNDLRKKQMADAEAVLLKRSPAVILAVQTAMNSPTADANKAMIAAGQDTINAIKDIQQSVARSFRPPTPEPPSPYLQGMGLEAAAKYTDEFLKKMKAGALSTEDIMIASAESVRIALELAQMAQAHAMTLSDLKQRQRILDAKSEVERCAQELLEAQRYLALHPNDPAALLRVEKAYAALQEAIARMIGATVGEAEMKQGELGEAMKALQIATATSSTASAEATTATYAVGTAARGQTIMTALKSRFIGVSGKDRIALAQQTMKEVDEYLKNLQSVIDNCQDPVYKKKLMNAAKTIKDRSVQLKIISTVKANDSGPEAEAAVNNIAKLLSDSIADTNNTCNALSLRTRFTKTVNTAIAVSKVASAFKKSLAKSKNK